MGNLATAEAALAALRQWATNLHGDEIDASILATTDKVTTGQQLHVANAAFLTQFINKIDDLKGKLASGEDITEPVKTRARY